MTLQPSRFPQGESTRVLLTGALLGALATPLVSGCAGSNPHKGWIYEDPFEMRLSGGEYGLERESEPVGDYVRYVRQGVVRGFVHSGGCELGTEANRRANLDKPPFIVRQAERRDGKYDFLDSDGGVIVTRDHCVDFVDHPNLAADYDYPYGLYHSDEDDLTYIMDINGQIVSDGYPGADLGDLSGPILVYEDAKGPYSFLQKSPESGRFEVLPETYPTAFAYDHGLALVSETSPQVTDIQVGRGHKRECNETERPESYLMGEAQTKCETLTEENKNHGGYSCTIVSYGRSSDKV